MPSIRAKYKGQGPREEEIIYRIQVLQVIDPSLWYLSRHYAGFDHGTPTTVIQRRDHACSSQVLQAIDPSLWCHSRHYAGLDHGSPTTVIPRLDRGIQEILRYQMSNMSSSCSGALVLL